MQKWEYCFMVVSGDGADLIFYSPSGVRFEVRSAKDYRLSTESAYVEWKKQRMHHHTGLLQGNSFHLFMYDRMIAHMLSEGWELYEHNVHGYTDIFRRQFSNGAD